MKQGKQHNHPKMPSFRLKGGFKFENKCDVKLKGNREVKWIDAFIFGNSQKIWDGPKEEHPTYWENASIIFSQRKSSICFTMD